MRAAFRLFLSGAKAGDAGAQHNLGYFYDVGVGLKPNRAAALYWYKRAFRSGCRIAASNIGTIFRDEKRMPRALFWFKRAARSGDGDANLEIAKLYYCEKTLPDVTIKYLQRAIRAREGDITEAGRKEAERLLLKLTVKNKRETKKRRAL